MPPPVRWHDPRIHDGRVVKVKRKARVKYTKDDISAALDDLFDRHKNLNETARKYGIPKQTLSDKVNQKHMGNKGKYPILIVQKNNNIPQNILNYRQQYIFSNLTIVTISAIGIFSQIL